MTLGGCPVTYKGNSKNGIIQERMEKAKVRLKKLRQGAWNLQVKTHMLLTSILPAALYGSEVTVIGQSQLDHLRSQAADAVVGEVCHSMNPALLLHLVDSHDLDPHLAVIVKALRAAKMFLVNASAADRRTFLEIAAIPSKDLQAP